MKLILAYRWKEHRAGDIIDVDDPRTVRTLIGEGRARPAEKGARTSKTRGKTGARRNASRTDNPPKPETLAEAPSATPTDPPDDERTAP